MRTFRVRRQFEIDVRGEKNEIKAISCNESETLRSLGFYHNNSFGRSRSAVGEFWLIGRALDGTRADFVLAWIY